MRNKKIWLIVVSMALVLVAAAVGTVAYLTDSTAAVTNTFTIGKLLDDPEDFVLVEHKVSDDDGDGVYTIGTEEVDGNEYTILPGVDLPKDPFVKTESELELDAYVFIEVVDETGTAISFTVDDANWTLLTGKVGPQGGAVYVMKANNGKAEAGAKLSSISILKKNANNKEITVANEEITGDGSAQFGGEVTFYAYMIQAGGFADYNAAWTGFVGTGD